MKIQDIFKLNLKTRGGVKLFHRIMNRYGIPKEDNVELKQNVEIASSCGGSSSNFPYRISYFKVNIVYWADIAERIVQYYPIIATVVGEVDGKIYIFDINLYDSNLLRDVYVFCVINWDITTPQETINLNKILKSFEGSPVIDYIEEITQEEYNNLRNQVETKRYFKNRYR